MIYSVTIQDSLLLCFKSKCSIIIYGVVIVVLSTSNEENTNNHNKTLDIEGDLKFHLYIYIYINYLETTSSSEMTDRFRIVVLISFAVVLMIHMDSSMGSSDLSS